MRSVKKAMVLAHPRPHRGGRGRGQHSSHYTEKIEMRRLVLDALGGVGNARILETHSGPGIMRRLAYAGAQEILSIDEDPASPDAVHADSRLVLRSHTLDLHRFNFFDVDPYGTPFEWLWMIAKLRPLAVGERIGVMITCGSLGALQRRISNGGEGGIGVARRNGKAVSGVVGLPQEQLIELGVDPHANVRHYTLENSHVLLQRAVAMWFAPATIVEWWGRFTPSIRYDGVVLARE